MSDTAAKPTIIFVSGAFHTEFHTRPILPFFQKAGYRILPVSLHCAGNPGTLEDEIEGIRPTVEAELQAGREICLILHSGGVFGGGELLNRLLAEGKITNEGPIRVILLATMPDWTPLLEYLQENELITFDFEKGQIRATRPYSTFYNDMKPDEAQPFVDAITYHSLYPPQISSEEWTKLPLTYIICERDMTIPPKFQREIARRYGMREIVMDSAHCPFISMPEKLVEVIDSALQS